MINDFIYFDKLGRNTHFDNALAKESPHLDAEVVLFSGLQ